MIFKSIIIILISCGLIAFVVKQLIDIVSIIRNRKNAKFEEKEDKE